MGTNDFDDSTEDRQWKQSTNQDTNVCNNLLKADNGASGICKNGLQVASESYATIKECS